MLQRVVCESKMLGQRAPHDVAASGLLVSSDTAAAMAGCDIATGGDDAAEGGDATSSAPSPDASNAARAL